MTFITFIKKSDLIKSNLGQPKHIWQASTEQKLEQFGPTGTIWPTRTIWANLNIFGKLPVVVPDVDNFYLEACQILFG